MWIAVAIIVIAIVVLYHYLAVTCFFTSVTFMTAYQSEYKISHSHVAGIRAAMDIFKGRAPFNELTEGELARAIEVLALIQDPREVADIIRKVDRRRDVSDLADPLFLRAFEIGIRQENEKNESQLRSVPEVIRRTGDGPSNYTTEETFVQVGVQEEFDPRIQQLLDKLEDDPDIQLFLSALDEIGVILRRYIAIHNRLFKTTLHYSRIMSGTNVSIGFQEDMEALQVIESDLVRVVNGVKQSDALRAATAAEAFFAYTSALRATVRQLRKISECLFHKSEDKDEYKWSQYKHDLAEYKKHVARYRRLGKDMNALFGR